MDQITTQRPLNETAEPGLDGPQDRQARILDAAERCFVRSGFHRTTMQDVAAEAGMSPGNLYRYFRSKDAIVIGLAERDRSHVNADFAELMDAQDFAASFAALGRKHFRDEPRERAILCLEIWAEATRNPTVAAVTHDFDRDINARLMDLLSQAQARGAIPAHVDPGALTILISTLANGLFVRRAISPTFDPEPEVGALMAVIDAALAGRIDLPKTGGDASQESAR
ncbi:MAG TPA: TetR/AcrR family transcriptional regulator [Microvirga sp.]|jgi:AcrR family transcriptional regulator|nr:TetR/AcrR family transcriptional regulator [Microvirga sp.]